MDKYHAAVDIGASSGRLILGEVNNGIINLEEIHRFENGLKEENGHLCWDTQYLFGEILTGLKKCKQRVIHQSGHVVEERVFRSRGIQRYGQKE